MPRPPDPPPPASSPRAQLLATEHWGLLAARSTAQSEVLTRITIFLTLFSAGLVSIALLGQATDFDGMFGAFAISVLVVVVVIGQLTQVRVMNVGIEDLGYVLAMNRMRAAYVELDPITGSMLGQRLYRKQWRTYRPLRPTPTASTEPARGPDGWTTGATRRSRRP